MLFKDANSIDEDMGPFIKGIIALTWNENAPNEDNVAHIDGHTALLELNIALFELNRAR